MIGAIFGGNTAAAITYRGFGPYTSIPVFGGCLCIRIAAPGRKVELQPRITGWYLRWLASFRTAIKFGVCVAHSWASVPTKAISHRRGVRAQAREANLKVGSFPVKYVTKTDTERPEDGRRRRFDGRKRKQRKEKKRTRNEKFGPHVYYLQR